MASGASPIQAMSRRTRSAPAWTAVWLLIVALLALVRPSLAQGDQQVTSYVTVSAPAPSTTSDAGSLNGPLRSTAAANGSGTPTSASTTYMAASTSVPTLELSNTQVPYLMQRPAAAHVKHATKPRVKSQFSGCSNTGLDFAAPSQRLNISAVYTQLDRSLDSQAQTGQPYTSGVLRITGVGAIAEEAHGAANETFAAIQVESRFLTFDIFSNLTFLCDNIAPTAYDNETQLAAHASCTYGPGTVAFGIDVPLNATYMLGTIYSRILLIDTSHPPLTIGCVDVPFSPYDEDAWYWSLMLWLPIALFLAYFVVVSMGRAITAATTRSRAFRNRAREGRAPSFLRDHLNPIIISAISGQGMVLSPALLRFATPGAWDILFQLQFVGVLAMCAVNWPDFAYPFFKQAAWASLVGNVTLIQSQDQMLTHANPTISNATLPSGAVGEQMNNISSPIYMNASAPANFLDLKDAYTGIPAFAEMIGLHRSDLFGTAMAVWLCIVAVFVAVAIAGWLIDTIALTTTKIQQRREDGGLGYQSPSDEPKGVETMASGTANGPRTPGFEDGQVFVADANGNIRDSRQHHYGFLGSWPKGFNPNPQFHMAALHGNVVRALAMFHLPITIFTVYQITHADEFTKKSVALAALSFAIVSILLPVYLIWRIARAPVKKLYDNIETLLALGPVYNTFSPGSQLFYCVTFAYTLVVGIVVGAAQRSGSAQSIIILVFEVLLALASSLWLPWGEGAMMGPVSFMTSVLRVISAVLLVLLSPVVDFSSQATQWITYVVLLLQGIFFAGAALILVFKLIESLIRLAFGVPYDERVNARSGGIGGAVRRIRRRRDKILQLSKPRRGNKHRHQRSSASGQSLMLSTTSPVMMSQMNTRPTSFISLPGSAMKGPVSPSGDASIPLSRSRQASFASYLDVAQQQQQHPAGGSTVPTLNKRQSQPSFDLLNGPYAAYFQQDGDEDANIMAALPPTSPGPWGAGNTPATPGSVAKVATPMGETMPAASSAPSVGFQRVAGGRATGANPYASIGTSKARDAFGRQTGAELSSTAAAAQFSRAHSRRMNRAGQMSGEGPSSPQRGRSGLGGVFRGFSRRSPRHDSVEEDYITSEEEDDPWAGTWGTSTLSTQHGPWNGLVKMQAALSGLKGRLTGQPPSAGNRAPSSGEGTLGGVSEEGGSLPPGPAGGFQVIRAPRRGGVGGASAADRRAEMAREYSRGQGQPVSQAPAHEDNREDLMDSTAIAMRHAYGHGSGSRSGSGSGSGRGDYVDPFGSPSGQQQQQYQRPDSRGSSAFFTPPPSRPLSSSGLVNVGGPAARPTSSHIVDDTPPTLQLRHLGGGGGSSSSNANTANPLRTVDGGAEVPASAGRPTSSSSGDALGILGADLRRAASDAREDAQEEERRAAQQNQEERFWLAPNGGGGGGAAGSSGPRQVPTSSANAWREGLTAKIELMGSSDSEH